MDVLKSLLKPSVGEAVSLHEDELKYIHIVAVEKEHAVARYQRMLLGLDSTKVVVAEIISETSNGTSIPTIKHPTASIRPTISASQLDLTSRTVNADSERLKKIVHESPITNHADPDSQRPCCVIQ